MNQLLQYCVRAGDTKACMLHCPMHWACVLVACMPTSCPRQYLWGHNISYICHAIMLIAHYLALTCPCTCSAAHTMLLLHLTSYSRVRLFCLVYKWCDVHPNVIVVLCLHSCVPACLQNVLFFFAFEPLLLSGHATFPRHSPHHSCSRSLRFHSFFQFERMQFAFKKLHLFPSEVLTPIAS